MHSPSNLSIKDTFLPEKAIEVVKKDLVSIKIKSFDYLILDEKKNLCQLYLIGKKFKDIPMEKMQNVQRDRLVKFFSNRSCTSLRAVFNLLINTEFEVFIYNKIKKDK
jgi:hypothetical protein